MIYKTTIVVVTKMRLVVSDVSKTFDVMCVCFLFLFFFSKGNDQREVPEHHGEIQEVTRQNNHGSSLLNSQNLFVA